MTNNRVVLKSCQTLHSLEKNNVTSSLSTHPAAIKPSHQQTILIKKRESAVLKFLTTRAWEMSLTEIFVPLGKITVSKVKPSARKHYFHRFSGKKLNEKEGFQ